MAARGEQFRSKAIAGRIGMRKGPVISLPKKYPPLTAFPVIVVALSSKGAENNVINETCAIFVVSCLFCFLSWPPGGRAGAPVQCAHNHRHGNHAIAELLQLDGS
jgi:hypothetical protein